jgi:hypothetical protein
MSQAKHVCRLDPTLGCLWDLCSICSALVAIFLQRLLVPPYGERQAPVSCGPGTWLLSGTWMTTSVSVCGLCPPAVCRTDLGRLAFNVPIGYLLLIFCKMTAPFLFTFFFISGCLAYCWFVGVLIYWGMSPLSDNMYLGYFLHSVACFFIFLVGFFKKFLIMMNFTLSFFWLVHFSVLRNLCLCLPQGCKETPLRFLLEALWF